MLLPHVCMNCADEPRQAKAAVELSDSDDEVVVKKKAPVKKAAPVRAGLTAGKARR